jgi:hypothetical protein
MAGSRFGDMVKGVVDIRREVLLLDADMHADQEAELLAEGSAQRDLWGINLYPAVEGGDWLEFDSMINIRPSFGNRSRGVDDQATRDAIKSVDRLVNGDGSGTRSCRTLARTLAGRANPAILAAKSVATKWTSRANSRKARSGEPSSCLI